MSAAQHPANDQTYLECAANVVQQWQLAIAPLWQGEQLLASHVLDVFDTTAAAARMSFLLMTGDGLPCNESELSHCCMGQANKDLLEGVQATMG